MKERIYSTFYNSEIGLIKISVTQKGVSELIFKDKIDGTSDNFIILENAVKEIDEYFKGLRKSFSVKLDIQGTDFQKQVWNSLLKINYGKTMSYKDIALSINNPHSVRAVGNANHVNKIAIIIPCHRVIGVNGKLVGYGAGLWRKEWLINHEKKYL